MHSIQEGGWFDMPKEPAQWAYDAWGDMRHWRVSNVEMLPQWCEQSEDIKNLWRNTVANTLVRGEFIHDSEPARLATDTTNAG